MKKGVKFCCLIVGLILVGSLVGWAVGSDEVRSYRTSTYGEYEERFSSNTTKPRDTAHARWMDVIHEDNLTDMSINEAEKDAADVTYDAVSISGTEAFKPLDANDNGSSPTFGTNRGVKTTARLFILRKYASNEALSPIQKPL